MADVGNEITRARLPSGVDPFCPVRWSPQAGATLVALEAQSLALCTL